MSQNSIDLKVLKEYLVECDVINLSLSDEELQLKEWFFYEFDLIDNFEEIRLLIGKLFLILRKNCQKISINELGFKLFGYTNYNLINNIYKKIDLSNYSFNFKKVNEVIEVNNRIKFFNNFKIYKTNFQDRNLKIKNKKVKKRFGLKNIFFNCRLSNGEMWNYLNILNKELVKLSQIFMINEKRIGNGMMNIFIESNGNKLEIEKDKIVKDLIKEFCLTVKYKNKNFYEKVEQKVLKNENNKSNSLKIDLFNNINLFLKNKYNYTVLNDVKNNDELLLELKKINLIILEESNSKIDTKILSVLLYTYNLLTKEKLNYKKWIYLYYLNEITKNKENIKDIDNFKVIEQSFMTFLNKKMNKKINDNYITSSEITNEYMDWECVYLPEIRKIINI